MASETEQPGSIIDEKYLLSRLLGKGSMSSVYEAEQISTGRPVALKILHARYKANHKALQRFRREAHVVTSLNHPNITEAYVFGVTADGQPYLALELIKGTTLAEEIAGTNQLSWQRIYHIANQLCDALEYAHTKGIVHRDLKPSNIMITKGDTGDDVVRVVDFGVSSLVSDEQAQKLTQTGEVIGTPAYMSPEQCRSQPATESSDIYALGCIIYEMCCGQKPFGGATPYEMMMKHTGDEMPPWQPHDNAIPAPMKDVIYNAMAKDVKMRYQKASEVKSDLRLASGNSAIASHARANPVKRMFARTPVRIAAVTIVLLLSVAAATYGNMFFRPKSPPSPPFAEQQIERQLPYAARSAAIEDSATLLGHQFIATQDAATVTGIRRELALAERYHTLAAQIRLDASFADQWRRINFYRACDHLASALQMIDKLDAHGEADRNLRLRRVSWIADLFPIMTDEDVPRLLKAGLEDIEHITAQEEQLDDMARAQIHLQQGALYETYGERTADLPTYKKALPEYKKSIAFWTKVYDAKVINGDQLNKIKNAIGNSISKIEAQH